MRRALCLILLAAAVLSMRAQHTFRGTSLSEALIALDNSDRHYDITFVYDELEDFTVTKTIQRGRSLPDAVREVCGFYPVRVTVLGKEIFVECIQKERTKLVGRLVDSEQHPVAYANIILFSTADSTMVGGGVSNEAGDFVIPTRQERVRARISCVGFKTLERMLTVGQVGTIHMQTEDYRLVGVTVSGQMAVLRSEADRLLYLVPNDPFAQGQSAYELLSRLPLVSMADGQASILGRGRAGFLLNGRTTAMDEETMRQKLWSLQAEEIERIEVITVPSGRYQFNGGGGLINIVTKQGQTLGWRGDLSAQLATSDDWSGRLGGTVNYAAEQFDASLDVFASRQTERTAHQTTYKRPQAFTKVANSIDRQKDRDLGASLTLHCQPAERWNLGAMLSYKENRGNQDLADEGSVRFDIDYAPYSGLGPNIRSYTMNSVSAQSPDGPMRTLGLTVYSDRMLDAQDKLLSLTYNYFRKSGYGNSEVEGDVNIPNYYTTDDYHAFYAFGLDTDYRIHSAKLDLTLPLPFAKVEAGLAYTDIDNTVFRQQERSSNIDEDRILNNSYNYQERNAAVYLNVHKQLLPQLSVTLGLRWDYSWLRGEERDDVKALKTKQPFSRLLPVAALQYQIDDRQHLTLHGERMINRPDFDDLNQTPFYLSMTNLLSGTPALTPGVTDLLELDYRHSGGLYANLYYRHGQDLPEWITRFALQSNQRYILENQTTRPENRLEEYQTGVYLRYQHRLGSLMDAALEGNIYYYHGESFDPDFDWNEDETFNANKHPLHGWGQSVALSADIFLNRRHTLLLNARYDHWFRQLEKMADLGAYGYASFALRYSLLGDRLKISLTAHDPFHQHVTDLTRSYCWFTEQVHTNHHAHLVSLTATWSLGGQKVRRTYRDKKDAETQRAEKRSR